MPICPVCNIGDITGQSESGFQHSIECTNCGQFAIHDGALHDLNVLVSRSQVQRELFAYLIRRRARPNEWIPVTPDLIEWVAAGNAALPDAIEQVDNLVLWLAEYTRPGHAVPLTYKNSQAIVGCSTKAGFAWVTKAAHARGHVSGPREDHVMEAEMTLAGWIWYGEVGRHKRSRRAFMAMDFENAELGEFVDRYFRPAVRRAGFELERLDDRPRAGSIDDRLRVEIRRSRFLICDLTDDNSGAYFEGGFAEGIGIPVIYTCRRDVLDDKRKGVHFDTRNHQVIPWTAQEIDAAAERLTATIRNSLPEEAALEDRAENG